MNLCQKSETKQTITAKRPIYQAPLLTPLPHLVGTLKDIERMTQTGSIGALLGTKVWHHKTMHKGGTRDVDNIVGGYQFKYGLPLIVLAQVALIYLINQNLR